MKHRYSDELLTSIVADSYSIAEILRKLNIVPAGGNYSTVRIKIKKLNLDTTHFTGMLWSKGRTKSDHLSLRNKSANSVIPLDQVLIKDRHTSSNGLKKRLIEEGIKSHICEMCFATEWLGKKIPLELHHADGDSTNNELDNIQLLCPNCHSTTSNYRGRNIGKV